MEIRKPNMAAFLSRGTWLPSLAVVSFCAVFPLAYSAESPHMQQPQTPTQWTDEQVGQVVAPVRAGRILAPKSWPNGNKIAVCITWDMDDEAPMIVAGDTSPVELARGEYGVASALTRILDLHDRLKIPATFFIPEVSALLHPQIITELKKRPQYEVGLHTWIHENLREIDNRTEEQRLLAKQMDFWTKAFGKRPVGFRASLPGGPSRYTLDLLRNAGFEYDSSLSAMDEPYEPLSYGKPTGLVELPTDWVVDDWRVLDLAENAALDAPELAYKAYRNDFDRAYKEGTLFMLTAHPMVSGHRARIQYLEDLIIYMRSKPGVWFATARQIAEYVRQQNAMTR
jgi:peptidoglycan/xylan/chitin deacetylase (PgdA/CDA1 family)